MHGERGVHGVLALQAAEAALKREIGRSLSRQCTMGTVVLEMILKPKCAITSAVLVKNLAQIHVKGLKFEFNFSNCPQSIASGEYGVIGRPVMLPAVGAISRDLEISPNMPQLVPCIMALNASDLLMTAGPATMIVAQVL